MASPEFWETRAGKTWLEVTIPEATKQLHRVADNLALVAEMLERIAKAKDDGGSPDGSATTTSRQG